MYCDKCGAQLQPDQAFCSRCGKQVGPSVIAMPRHRGRVQEHLNLIAILWLAFSALNAVGGIVLLIIANTIFIHGSVNAPPFLHSLLGALGGFILAKAAVGLAAAFGLIQRESWARTLILILAFIALFTSIPFGTALGIYTLWALMPRESEQEYETMVAARAA
jgi:phage shock protein PspC (stress-responsive transcriptional regulator)